MIIKYALRHFSKAVNSPVTSKVQEYKMKIGNYNINYAKFGHGPHHIVCIPGGLGTITSHYKDQIDGFDKEKFTIVSFDPPGFGKSYPPERILDKSCYEMDSDIAYELMKCLNIPKYSCLGWSAGGSACMILAGKYPHAIHKLVIWGTQAFLLEKNIVNYRRFQDMENWNINILKQRMIETYGKEKFAWYCNKMKNLTDILEADPDICRGCLKNILCPTFILHGKKDPLSHISHVSFLCNHIKNVKSYVYPEGKHDIHMQYSEDFNQRVQEFLLEKFNESFDWKIKGVRQNQKNWKCKIYLRYTPIFKRMTTK